MRRFIYTPEVTAYIRSEEAGKVFDVSKDITAGSVTRRLDAVSNASVTLQNKFGLYTRKFKSMDRIAIFMRRIGDPMLVFTGYVDEAPFYQMYPAPVTIQASCTLKLLQNTYFDPGLPFMTQWFQQFGWVYDPSSGTITDPFMGFGNFDLTRRGGHKDGNLGLLIAAALHEIGGWPSNHIFVRSIPRGFTNTIHKLMKTEALEYKDDYERAVQRMQQLLGIGLEGDGTGPDSELPSFTGTNASATQLVSFAWAAGFRGDNLVLAVAVALAESSGKTNAMNYNTNGTYDVGSWQINTVHTSGGGGGLPAPPGGVGTLNMPKDFNAIKDSLPVGVKNYMIACTNPTRNAQEAFAISSHGRSFSPWATYTSGVYREHMAQAIQAVNAFKSRNQSNPSDSLVNPSSQGLGSVTQYANTDPVANNKKAPVGQVDISPNANLPGHPIMAKVILFDRILAAAFGGKLVVGTGTNHNQYSSSGNVSDHYTGEATDIVTAGGASLNGSQGAINPTLTRLGQMALIVAGESPASARQKTGGLFNKNYANGCRIQIIFNTTEGGNHFNHLHIGIKGNLPDSILKGNKVTGIAGDPQTQQGQETQNIETIARQAAWFTETLPTSDTITAMSLSGKRALANDIPLFEWITQMVKSGGRRFCSMPNGDFLAFFPDYFNDFDRTPYFIIRPIEVIDLQIQVSDRDLVTHVFATGTQFSQQVTLFDRMVSMVASVQEPAFDMFINVAEGKLDKETRKGKKNRKKFDPEAFLKRYGARPLPLDLPDIRHPILLWMAAWMEFQKHWANQFGTTASFTFMPELLPGGIVNIDNKITMFVESVTHTWDLEGGFQTTAELNSPASVNKKDTRFGSMVLAGGNFGVAASIAEDKEVAKNAGPPPVRTVGGRAIGD